MNRHRENATVHHHFAEIAAVAAYIASHRTTPIEQQTRVVTKDRLLRRLVPSAAVIARWPMVGGLLDAADWVLRRRDPRYAQLPPASLRMRIGVGNRILRNVDALESGHAVIRRCVERGWVRDGAQVLDLGCGIGRNAVALHDQVELRSYDGVDVDAEMVAWCKEHLADDRMRFHHADLFSTVYNPGGRPVTGYRLPLADGSMTFSLGVSLFSHLVSRDARHYAAELARVTAAGGFAVHTFFLLDHLDGHLGDRWTFDHEAEGCRLENEKYPEAAVAFWEGDIRAMFAEQGFEVVDLLDTELHQQTIVFRRLN